MRRYGISEVIVACYRKLLLREPEVGALEAHSSHINAHKVGPEDLIEGFLRGIEFESVAPHFMRHYVKSHTLINDNSQNGEVAYLIRSMVNDSARHRYVVDVGARGRDRSNSFDLLKYFGWRGLLVEANPNLISQITSDFEGLNYQLRSCAVANYEGNANFYFGMNDDVSSLDKEGSAAWGELRGECVVPVRRLPSILLDEGVPEDFDLLSLDIEGADISVMNDLISNSSYRPTRVIIEIFNSHLVQSLGDLPFDPSVVQEYALLGSVGANLVLKRKAKSAT